MKTMPAIFISHAAKDEQLVEEFVDLLQVGIGVHPDDIFCSSLPGMGISPPGRISSGYIKAQVTNPDLVLLMISHRVPKKPVLPPRGWGFLGFVPADPPNHRSATRLRRRAWRSRRDSNGQAGRQRVPQRPARRSHREARPESPIEQAIGNASEIGSWPSWRNWCPNGYPQPRQRPHK